MDVVSTTWNWQIQGSPFFVWEEKLRVLKKELKKFAKSLISPTSKRKEVQTALESHQLIMEDVEVSQELLQKQENLQKYFHRACRVEEEY